jgi:hypothetical protein
MSSSISPVAIRITLTAVPIISRGRFSPLGPTGILRSLRPRPVQCITEKRMRTMRARGQPVKAANFKLIHYPTTSGLSHSMRIGCTDLAPNRSRG